jgi:hypothetical protein
VTERALICHPGAAPAARLELSAEIGPTATGVRVRYRLCGELERVAVPARVPSRRADRLWERTCFEAFIAPEGRAHYVELNVSPSTEWAAYVFDGYRHGMRPLPLPSAPTIAVLEEPGELRVTADLDFSGIEDAPWPWRVGLCAVIVDRAGGLSYWALRHPAAKPDFHDAAGFSWRLTGSAR